MLRLRVPNASTVKILNARAPLGELQCQSASPLIAGWCTPPSSKRGFLNTIGIMEEENGNYYNGVI